MEYVRIQVCGLVLTVPGGAGEFSQLLGETTETAKELR